MDAQSILNKVMGLLGVEKQVKLGGDVYAKLGDGNTVAAASFSVGQPVYFIDKNGSRSQMEDGKFEVFLPSINGAKKFQMIVQDGAIQFLELNDMGQENVIPQNALNKYTTPPETNLNKLQMENVKKVVINPAPNFRDEMVPDIEDVRMAVVSSDDEQANEPASEKKKAEDTIGKVAEDEIQMAEGDSSRLDAMDAQIKQLRDDIANLFASMKEDTSSEAMKMMPKKQMMSNKKLTGAPASEKVELQGLFKIKNGGSFQTVLNRMAK
jgi:hypothetical protein